MYHRSFFIGVIVLVLLFSLPARSQEPTARGLDESSAAAVRKKAIDLLQSVAGRVDSLNSAENRARIGSNVADLLWNHDEKLARGLFAAVEQDIKAGFNETEPNDSRDREAQHTRMVFLQLRRDTLDRIVRHDPDLALTFLRATKPPPLDAQWPYEMPEGEGFLELRLASQIAAKSPQIALQLGRESLAKGFSPDLLLVVSRLLTKDKEASLSFYAAIVEKLKRADLERDPAAGSLALNLAQSVQPPEADELIYRELIGILLASALANGCGEVISDHTPRICFDMGSLFSRIQRYYPQSAAAFKRWAQYEQGFGGPPSLKSAQVQDVIQNGTIDEILALAPKYPDLYQLVYWTAMRKAEASGDVARAREIANSCNDDEQRRNMLAQIDYNQKQTSVNANELAAIQKEISSRRSNEERIDMLLFVANRIGGNDRKAAFELLNQANQIIESTRPGKTQVEGQIKLAMLYCSLKSERGFAIMETVMPKLNQLVTAAAALDGFENNYLREGEWNMTGAGVVGALLTALAQNAGHFAGLDFDRSVTLAEQFERPELRLMAQLKIAQGVLVNRQNPTPLPPGRVVRMH